MKSSDNEAKVLIMKHSSDNEEKVVTMKEKLLYFHYACTRVIIRIQYLMEPASNTLDYLNVLT